MKSLMTAVVVLGLCGPAWAFAEENYASYACKDERIVKAYLNKSHELGEEIEKTLKLLEGKLYEVVDKEDWVLAGNIGYDMETAAAVVDDYAKYTEPIIYLHGHARIER